MAGDWIKIEESMPEKPEVCIIASVLGIEDPDTVAGKLVRVWAWASRNCNADGVTDVTAMKHIDRCAGVVGFASAMEKAGWLVVHEGKARFPNFDRHCSKTAKERALAVRRVEKHRTESCNAASVTKPLPEKRREEVKKRERENAGAESVRPSLDQAKAAAANIGITTDKAEEWWNCREANGWLKGAAGGGTMPVGMNWQADLTTYAKRGNGHNCKPDHRAEKRAREFQEPAKTIPDA